MQPASASRNPGRGRAIKTSLLVYLLGLVLTGCTSFHIFPIEDRDALPPATQQYAFVTNPELTKEMEILRLSELYVFTDADTAEVRITLKPLSVRRASGTGRVLVSLLFLGLVPVYYPDVYWYEYDVASVVEPPVQHSTELLVATRLWLLNVFRHKADFEQKLGEALRAKESGRQPGQ